MARTAADVMIERLIDWGVDTVFGLPGDGINGIMEALRKRQDKIRFVHVRHEEAAAFMAVGYAKASGRLGVCLATSGPGGIHLLNGLYDAKLDRVPVLAMTGMAYHDLIHTHQQQDVELDKLFMDVAAYSIRVMGPAHVVNVVDEAIRNALGRRTVAHVNVPKDVQDWTGMHESDANVPEHSADVFFPPHPVPSRSQLDAAAEVLNAGSRVAMLVGRGALGAREEVLDVSRRLGAPIVKALLGKAVVPDRDPRTTGGIGLLGTSASFHVMKHCDTLLIVGSSFPYLEFYPRESVKTVQIDASPERIGLRHAVHAGLVGDSREVLRLLLPLLEGKRDDSFVEDAQREMKEWRRTMEERANRDDVPMKPQVVLHELSPLLDDDAIVSSDSGTIATWSARHVDIRGTMQFSLSGSLASMGNGLPYSIGAAIAYPGRQVVCVVGDGGFTMLMGDLATLVKYGLNVKVIVMKNNSLGMIKWEQIVLEGNPQYGVDLQPIDFAAYAAACGVPGFTIEKRQDAASVLKEALAVKGPALVQAVVDAQEPPMPGHVSTKMALHFGEALLKGQKQGWEIFEKVMKERIREVV